MTREQIIQSGLLDQYVLGLTNRRQTEVIERFLEEDEELRLEVERLHENLSAYADANAIDKPEDGRRSPRTMEDFYSLDHDMILELTERNHSLNIWRYTLIAACAVLLGVCGFLFRAKEEFKANLLVEQARHAQDNRSHERERTVLTEEDKGRQAFRTVEATAEKGILRAHFLDERDVMLVDLSDLDPPRKGYHYYVLVENRDRTPEPAAELDRPLLPVSPAASALSISVYEWPISTPAPAAAPEEPPVAYLRL